MSTTFFISDTHFGHNNILTFEPFHRPFKTLEEHDQVLMDNWNKVIKKGDIVYHLGDVCFKKEQLHRLKGLNGDKRLIMGNHDHYATADYLKVFTKLYGALQYNGNCILTHIPVNEHQLENRFKYNIHGHLHSKNVRFRDLPNRDLRYINVSCEQINLTPISWDELKEKYIET